MGTRRFAISRATLLAALASLGSMACGGQLGDGSGDSGGPGAVAEGGAVEDGGSDARGGDDATIGAETDAEADVFADASPGADADAYAGDDADADADAGAYDDVVPVADADADADASCVMTRVPDQPSPATVNFVFTNTSAQDRYVVTDGRYCKAFVIGDFILSTQPWQEQCEGPPPYVSVTFSRIPAGGSLTVSWDARQAVAYATNVDCSPWGRPCAPTQMASLQAVPSGSYVATFGIATPPDAGSPSCTGTLDRVYCGTGQEGGWGAFLNQCPADAFGGGASSIMQPFTVPASGTVTVPISIP
jgi:hypothetical protein